MLENPEEDTSAEEEIIRLVNKALWSSMGAGGRLGSSPEGGSRGVVC